MKKLNKKGFTLVELLAVIVILALLMVVAASTVGNVQENAKKNSLKTEAQKLINSAYQEAQSEVMLTGNYSAPQTKHGTDGKYTYSVIVSTSGNVTEFCVNYNGEMSIKETGLTDTGSPKIQTDTGVQLTKDSGYCTINSSTGAITYKTS